MDPISFEILIRSRRNHYIKLFSEKVTYDLSQTIIFRPSDLDVSWRPNLTPFKITFSPVKVGILAFGALAGCELGYPSGQEPTIKYYLAIEHWFWFTLYECPNIYRKHVLHLLKRTWNMRISRFSTDLR